jgi:hypothetical protein
MASQFEFLKSVHKGVFEHCEITELYCNSDPRTSAWRGRLALETALKHLFRVSYGLPEPGSRTLGELLSEPAFRSLEQGRPYKLARIVHRIGNKGSHDDKRPPSRGEAMDALEALFEFMKWFALNSGSTGLVIPSEATFDRSLLPEIQQQRSKKITFQELIAAFSLQRADLLRILDLDGVAAPIEPLDDAQVTELRKYLELGELFTHIKPFAEMSPKSRELFEAVAEVMPENVWRLKNGALITDRMGEFLAELITSAWDTEERFRFRWLLVHGDLKEIISRLDSVDSSDDPLIVSVARAWRSAMQGHGQSDWMMLASIESRIPNRLAALLAEQGDTAALARIPDDLLAPNSEFLGIELSFDVRCSRLLCVEVPTADQLWSFVEAWMGLQDHSTEARFVLLSRPLFSHLREHLRARLWQVVHGDYPEFWWDLAGVIREFAPGDELSEHAAGLAGDSSVLAGNAGVWPMEWCVEIRRQFATIRGLDFVEEESIRTVANETYVTRGNGSKVTALDLIGNAVIRSAFTGKLKDMDLRHNEFHEAMASAITADCMQDLADLTSLIDDKLRRLVGLESIDNV